MVKALNSAGMDCCAWNYRSCSGEPNRQLRMYHNGTTDDLDLVIRHAITKRYENIVLVGFSMGGNLSLLYLGQQSDKLLRQVKGAVTFSVPIDLKDSSERLSSLSCKIYMNRFLRLLHRKVRDKMQLFPDQIDDRDYDKIRNFKDFDDRYTAPLHGFADAEDYWSKCSCGPLLGRIRVPCLIVNAADDPFLGPASYPEAGSLNDNIHLRIPLHGGHAGFINRGINDIYWSEICAVEFIRRILK
jgi:predicted alpha/beta-fold hydrolase